MRMCVSQIEYFCLCQLCGPSYMHSVGVIEIQLVINIQVIEILYLKNI